MNTETTPTKWPLLTAILAARGISNGVELFEAARKGAAETDTDAKLGVVVPDDNMSIGHVRGLFLIKAGRKSEDDRHYVILGQEAENGRWWQIVFGPCRIEMGKDFTREAYVAWEEDVHAELGTVNFADPRDKETIEEILIDVVAVLGGLFPSDTGCGG